MRRLSSHELATIILDDLTVDERVGVAAAALQAISDPMFSGALRDASNRIARHADHLERLLVDSSSGTPRGQCQPEGAEPAPGHFPQGSSPVALGAFPEAPQ